MEKTKTKKLTFALLLAIAAVCAILTLTSLLGTGYKPVSATVGSAGWTKQGSATVGTPSNGYYPISGMLATSTRASRAGYNEKVTVNGLSVSFYVDNWSDGPIGFGFGDSVSAFPPDLGNYFCTHFRKGNNNEWDFLYFTNGWNFADEYSVAYKDTALSNHAYGIDGLPRYAFNNNGGATTNIGVNLIFEKENGVWKITVSGISGKGNLERHNQDYCYVEGNKIPDQAYVIAWGEMKNSPVANFKIETGVSSGTQPTPSEPTEPVVPTPSGDWTTRGTGTVQISGADNGYTKINVACNGNDYGKGAYYKEAVAVDGLVLYMYTKNIGNAKLGLGFADTLNGYPPESSNRFNVVLKQTTDWNFAYFVNSHDVNGGTQLAYENSALTDKTYGIDGNQFYGYNKTNEFGVKLKFNKVNDNVWRIVTTLIEGQDSNRNQSTTTYISNDYVNGANKYLTFWAMDATTDVYVKVSNNDESEITLNEAWTTKGDGSVALSQTNSGVRFVMERGVAVISQEKFNVKNFEMTLNLDDISDGWWLIGFTKEQRLFNSDSSIDKLHDTGFFLRMSKFSPVCAKCHKNIGNADFFRCPTSCRDGNGTYYCLSCSESMRNGGKYDCDNCKKTLNYISGYNLDVRVETLENVPDKPNGEVIPWNFEKGHRGNFEVKYSGANQLKLRMYPDESGKYLQIEINGSILRNQRIRLNDDINDYMFDSDGKGYLIFQCWKDSASSKDSFEIKTINNKSVLTENYYIEDKDNLKYQAFVFEEDDTVSSTEEQLSAGCKVVSKANKSELIGGSLACLAISAVGIFLIKRRGGKDE